MKPIITCAVGCLLVTFMKVQTATGQYYPPKTEDTKAQAFPIGALQTGVANTGTDVVAIDDRQKLQVAVWDNGLGEVMFSSALQAVGGAPTAKDAFRISAPGGYTSLSDPDVALSRINGRLYADVVYLASVPTNNGIRTQTFFDAYTWDANTNKFVHSTGSYPSRAMGVATVLNLPQYGGTLNRSHSSPNIDANADGRVGIVWQETSVETAKITVLSASYSPTSNPPYPNGYSYIQEGLVFAESFVKVALADGNPYDCADWRGVPIKQAGSYNPNPTLQDNNPPILFNQTIKPDVAVSVSGDLWVSYLVSNASQSGPPVATGLNLFVRLLQFDCIASEVESMNWSEGVTLNQPRLAVSANAKGFDDVEVVQAWSGGACVEGSGSRSYYEIRNWGRTDGNFRDSYSVVTQATIATQNGYPASEPVVAFNGLANGDYTGHYVVAWTGTNYPDAGLSQDVWARTLKGGTPVYSGYSRVNFSEPENEPKGRQRTPSVAARFSNDKQETAFLFVNEETSSVNYRYSSLPVGDTNLNRPAGPGNSVGGASQQQRTTLPHTLEAYPNPSNQSVELRVSLHAGEAVQQLQITDLSGRVLDTVPLSAGLKASEAAKGSVETTLTTYTWQPRPGIPTGTYMLKLVTNQRTERIAVVRN